MSAMLAESRRAEATAVVEAPRGERKRKRVVIIGGGFAGIAAAHALRHADAEVLMIDRRNHHIFQPLLYQVATAVLSPAEIAAPIRQLEAKQRNVSVVLAEVTSVDVASRTIEAALPGAGARKIAFDYLVVTTEDEGERARQMTFVLVGAGPTGVELVGSLAQLAQVTLRGNFRRIDPAKASIILLDASKRVLPTFAESVSRKVTRRLEKLGVKVLTGVKVETVDEQGVIAGGKRIPSATVLWTAGVAASPIPKMLGTTT